MKEFPHVFSTPNGETLLGVYHQPVSIKASAGVLVIVGGPQTKVGSHRQFVLLARYLSSQGVPVFRFDYSGMGDSTGEADNFLKKSSDVKVAIEKFLSVCPEVKSICLWGLCDAASLSLLYFNDTDDKRVESMVLLNPWVRQASSEASTMVRHYYLKRVLQRELWVKFLRLDRELFRSAIDFVGTLVRSLISKLNKRHNVTVEGGKIQGFRDYSDQNYVDGMLAAVQKFDGKLTVILSGDDMTADEFRSLIKSDDQWKSATQKTSVQMDVIKEANHTFSTQSWRHEVERLTLAHLQ